DDFGGSAVPGDGHWLQPAAPFILAPLSQGRRRVRNSLYRGSQSAQHLHPWIWRGLSEVAGDIVIGSLYALEFRQLIELVSRCRHECVPQDYGHFLLIKDLAPRSKEQIFSKIRNRGREGLMFRLNQKLRREGFGNTFLGRNKCSRRSSAPTATKLPSSSKTANSSGAFPRPVRTDESLIRMGCPWRSRPASSHWTVSRGNSITAAESGNNEERAVAQFVSKEIASATSNGPTRVRRSCSTSAPQPRRSPRSRASDRM